MPARSSSLIPRPLGQLADTAPTVPDDLPGLLTCLAQLPDPRRDQGRRHPLAFVLSLAACAVLAGAKSLAAIAEWAADAPPNVLARLGGPCREPGRGPVAPAEATVRRVLQRIDGDALDTAAGSWLAGRERAAGQEENAPQTGGHPASGPPGLQASPPPGSPATPPSGFGASPPPGLQASPPRGLRASRPPPPRLSSPSRSSGGPGPWPGFR
ncbi:transposase family protein [Streptomyces capoamus]|uniref:transposase family protein n=1 Tax=Streptomyces capoamus TaxID=68183 RepID=UPI0033948809